MPSFKDKKILVFGLGLNQGGVGSAKFFAQNGAEVRITDLKSKEILKSSLDQLKDFPQISYTLGEHKYEDLDWADIVIKNPAVKPGNPFMEYAHKNHKEVETDMGIFLQFVKSNQIVGVTGTKGKSTTASLAYGVLKNGSKDVILAGNIGISVLDSIQYIKKNTLVVLEISSFQLEAFQAHQVSPKWAIVTNITPDHLNYYNSMDEYIAVKKVIGLYQTPQDFLFINKDDPTTNNPGFLNDLQGQITFYSSTDLPEDFQPILKGEHNKSNIAAALALGKTFNIDSNLLLKTLADFKGVPFRMELIKEWGGIKIYNDTTATSPEAGIRAVETFPNCILICGGMNKKMDYTKYAESLRKNVKKVFFLEGDSTEEIQKLLGNNSKTYNNLEVLLQDIKKEAKPGDIIIFSPAATSFNLFQNEFDRGRKFNEAVRKVFNDA